ncbi:MAG: SAM-dependent methyltransferase [Thermoguttaceae bacterium]
MFRSRPRAVACALVFLTATTLLVRVPQTAAAEDRPASRLYLVGVGPGDPDLITLRALDVIKNAQVIFYTDGIREKFGPQLEGKEVIGGYWRLFPYYGKDPSTLPEHERREAEALAQRRKEFITRVRQAVAQGKTVAILDHGDPLIYGPWAWCLEEFEDLKPVVVPGVSSFNAANAALRRCVTTAEQTKAVILTSTDWPGKTDTIEKLSAHGSTMVVFTMRAKFQELIQKLSVNYPPDTPVAVVKYAGYQDREEVIRGTLQSITAQVADQPLPFEYLIYVGQFLNHRYKTAEPPAPAAAAAAASPQ